MFIPTLTRARAFFTLSLLLALVLAGCESDGTTGFRAPNPGATNTGTFIDATVDGFEYSRFNPSFSQNPPTPKRLTGPNGQFEYVTGEWVTFTVGDIILGIADGQEFVTPADLRPSTGPALTRQELEDRLVNLVRFLQSVDEDRDPDINGISIPAIARTTLPANPIDFAVSVATFESSPDLLTYLSLVSIPTGANFLVPLGPAVAHFDATILDLVTNQGYTDPRVSWPPP